MKWLKWIGIILAVLLILPVLTLLVLGQRKDAGHVHHSIEIAASPQQIWPWLEEGEARAVDVSKLDLPFGPPKRAYGAMSKKGPK